MTLPEEEPDVIDGLLSELLGESVPPDVSARVIERLSQPVSQEQLDVWGRAVALAGTELDEPSPWLVERDGGVEPLRHGWSRSALESLVGRVGGVASRSRHDSNLRLGLGVGLVLVAVVGVWWLGRQPRFAPVESVVASSVDPSDLESRRLWAELNRQAARSPAAVAPRSVPLRAGGAGDGGAGDQGGAGDRAGAGGPATVAVGGGNARESVESILYRPASRSEATQSASTQSASTQSATSGSAAVGEGERRGALRPFGLAGAGRAEVWQTTPVRPLPDHEVVHWIDTLMVQLWQEAAVPASERVEGELWQRRVGQLAWGELPLDDSSERPFQSDSPGRKLSPDRRTSVGGLAAGWDRPASLDQQLGWLFEQVNQRQFAEFWAIELAENWFGAGSTLDSAAVAMFTEELASRLHLGRSVGRIQKRIMRDVALSLETCNSDPTSPMVIPVLHAAEHGSAELVDRLYSRWAGATVSCGRCHHSRSVSEVGEDDFWGLAALLQPLGVESQTIDPGDAVVAALRGKRLRQRPRKELFRERADGRLVAAVPRLPGGPAIDGELELPERLDLVADWLRSDAVVGPSLVNWVWQQMLGQPLVPVLGVADVPVAGARRELMELLVSQLLAHGGDMRRLVVWIAASRPMWAKQVELDPGQLLLMSRHSSESLRRSDLSFATFRNRRLDAAVRSVSTRRLELLAQGAAVGSRAEYDRRFLAQADPSSVPERGDASRSPQVEIDPWLMLHWQRLPNDEVASDVSAAWRAWLESLAGSGLDWSGQLEHVYMATACGSLQPRERQLADGILKSVSGDSIEALNRVMTVLLGF